MKSLLKNLLILTLVVFVANCAKKKSSANPSDSSNNNGSTSPGPVATVSDYNNAFTNPGGPDNPYNHFGPGTSGPNSTPPTETGTPPSSPTDPHYASSDSGIPTQNGQPIMGVDGVINTAPNLHQNNPATQDLITLWLFSTGWLNQGNIADCGGNNCFGNQVGLSHRGNNRDSALINLMYLAQGNNCSLGWLFSAQSVLSSSDQSTFMKWYTVGTFFAKQGANFIQYTMCAGLYPKMPKHGFYVTDYFYSPDQTILATEVTNQTQADAKCNAAIPGISGYRAWGAMADCSNPPQNTNPTCSNGRIKLLCAKVIDFTYP